MFRIKICGITNAADAEAAIDAGADAIGLNFYRGSKRFIDFELAETIAGQVPNGVSTVGVFVNHDLAAIQEAAGQLGLDFVQLHGDESPEFMAQLSENVRVV